MAAGQTLFFAVALLCLLFFNAGRKIESVWREIHLIYSIWSGGEGVGVGEAVRAQRASILVRSPWKYMNSEYYVFQKGGGGRGCQ